MGRVIPVIDLNMEKGAQVAAAAGGGIPLEPPCDGERVPSELGAGFAADTCVEVPVTEPSYFVELAGTPITHREAMNALVTYAVLCGIGYQAVKQWYRRGRPLPFRHRSDPVPASEYMLYPVESHPA